MRVFYFLFRVLLTGAPGALVKHTRIITIKGNCF
jgi:hypothetical protein